jgi:hypothetical protein
VNEMGHRGRPDDSGVRQRCQSQGQSPGGFDELGWNWDLVQFPPFDFRS